MNAFRRIKMDNCRLCHCNPGETKIFSDQKLIHEIFTCVEIQVQDEYTQMLPTQICGNCEEMVRNFYKFKQHIKEIDECLRRIAQEIAQKVIERTEIQKLNDRTLHKCKKCPATFHIITEYNSHVQSHSLSKYHCLDCGKSYRREVNYKSHNCLKNREIDNMSGNDLRDETDHVETESTTIINLNDFTLDVKDELIDHPIKSHQFTCHRMNCAKVCKSATSLKTHELRHDDKRSFLCVTCGKSFLTKNSLTCHEKIHLEVKAYSCKLCNIGFSVRSNLRAHEKKYHEGIRFYCSQCTKAFVTKCSLERHLRIHTGIREFECQSCTSAFYTNKELVKHQRYHQGLRQHKCEECFKTFFERHHLIIHLRSHTGERPYVCKIPGCGKSFTESQKLKRHHNAKHPQTT